MGERWKEIEDRAIEVLLSDAIKKLLLTIFPAAVGLNAAAMFSRYLPLRAIDFLTMSFPPEARSTVF